MPYKTFAEIIKKLKNHSKLISDAYTLGIDLIGLNEDLDKIISLLFQEIYGKNGYEWIEWFVYERKGSEFQAWDENKKPICYSVKSLWEYVEENHRKLWEGGWK
jgi:hypothetical protein